MRFTSETTADGVSEHLFTLHGIPGVLWSPADGPGGRPLVLLGHGGGRHKKAQELVARARRYVTARGYAVAAIDAPGHGDRPRTAQDERLTVGIGERRAAGEPIGPLVARHNAGLAARAVPEWQAVLDALRKRDVGARAPVGYWGVSLGTAIGVPLAAAEPRITAAVFGLAGHEALAGAAAQVTVPVEFLLQWDDELVPRESGLALFDAFASREKTLHANAGLHADVPALEQESSERFFARHLAGGDPGDEPGDDASASAAPVSTYGASAVTGRLTAVRHFAAYDGTDLAYHVSGDGVPVICLPGGPMQDSAYLGDLGGLSAHRRLVRMDLRGTGRSAVPEDIGSCRCDRLVDDVEALREHLGLGRVDLLAHCAGANIAVLYAARHPERVNRLVLVTPSTWAVGIETTGEARREVARLRQNEPWFDAAFAALEAIVAGDATEERWRAIEPFLYGRWDAAAQAHQAAQDTQRHEEAASAFGAEGAFDPEVTRAALAAFAAPVLLLAGEVDLNTVPSAVAEYAGLFPDAEFVVQPRAGHFPWLDDARRSVATIATFLGEGRFAAPDADAARRR